jgi:hypothetical protein
VASQSSNPRCEMCGLRARLRGTKLYSLSNGLEVWLCHRLACYDRYNDTPSMKALRAAALLKKYNHSP